MHRRSDALDRVGEGTEVRASRISREDPSLPRCRDHHTWYRLRT